MDFERTKFGRGPRELGGSVDLINYYKLIPHHDFFCKKSLPLSIADTHYLHNVVGDAEIRKGEGMELDHLFQNNSFAADRHAHLHPFGLDVLGEAFQMRETTPIDLPSSEKGIPTPVTKLVGKSKDRKKHKRHKHGDREKDEEHKKHKHRHKESIKRKKDDKRKSGCDDKEKDKYRSRDPNIGPESFLIQQDKPKKFKINPLGILKIAQSGQDLKF